MFSLIEYIFRVIFGCLKSSLLYLNFNFCYSNIGSSFYSKHIAQFIFNFFRIEYFEVYSVLCFVYVCKILIVFNGSRLSNLLVLFFLVLFLVFLYFYNSFYWFVNKNLVLFFFSLFFWLTLKYHLIDINIGILSYDTYKDIRFADRNFHE